jgi:cell division protease FtsH
MPKKKNATPHRPPSPANRGESGPNPKQPPMPPRRTWAWFLLILLANYLLFSVLFPGKDRPVNIPYTLFKDEVNKKNVEAIYTRGD